MILIVQCNVLSVTFSAIFVVPSKRDYTYAYVDLYIDVRGYGRSQRLGSLQLLTVVGADPEPQPQAHITSQGGTAKCGPEKLLDL